MLIHLAASAGALALALGTQAAPPTPGPAALGGYDGCLVVQEAGAPAPLARLGAACAERVSPCSTFKIPNALIGLETGVVTGADTLFAWDGAKRPREELNRDHTLASAMRASVVWYFQELARKVGAERMKAAVASIPYGNADTSAGVDTFWLGSSLLISADEQVAFLDRLRRSDLPFSPRAQQTVREILVQEGVTSGIYRGKTGSCDATATAPPTGWWVGWMERGGKATTFAMLIRGQGARGTEARRLAELELARLGVLPPMPVAPPTVAQPAPTAYPPAGPLAAAPPPPPGPAAKPPPPPPPAADPVLFVLDMGYDWGETRILKLTYTDNTSDELDANDGWWISAGAAGLRFTAGPLSFDSSATLGIKYKRIGIDEGNMRYLAYPLELTERVVYKSVRLGAGVDVALSPSLKGGGVFDGKAELERAVGLLGTIEWVGGYRVGHGGGGIGIRILRQRLQNKAGGESTSANAIGIMLRVEG
ncbi:MAG: penicillin-binding transpeptidase domain-containing protein [Anaeromyxobacter sp.]